MIFKKIIVFIVLCTSAVFCQSPIAATRLGLFHTQEEVDIWKVRMASGPYKTSGDVSTNSPGDWTLIASNASSFLGNPSQERWDGQTSATCLVIWDPPPPLDHGEKLRDAAFYYLLTDNTAYRDAVETELLAQVAETGTDFTDTARWCHGLGDTNPSFQITMWLTKILIGYDFIRSSISAANKTTIDSWFYDAAVYWEYEPDNTVEKRFPNRDSDNYTPTGYGTTSSCRILYYGGPTVCTFQKAWNNRGSSMMRFAGVVGVMLDNTSLINNAKRWVKEFIKYGTFSNGAVVEYERWTDTHPCKGWGYATTVIGDLAVVADALARNEDTELYNYETSDGLDPAGSGGDTSGGPKSLDRIILFEMQHLNHTQAHYGTDNASRATNSDYLMDSDANPINAWESVGDTHLVVGNLYYQDAFVKSIYMRTASGAPAYPSNPASSTYNIWGGPQGIFPGALFMFGNMEGTVDPYTLGTIDPPPEILSITINTTGTSLEVNFDMDVTESGTGSDWSLSMTHGAVTLSSPSEIGTSISYSLSRIVHFEEEVVSFSYTQPGNGIESEGTAADLATIASYAGSFTNYSDVRIKPMAGMQIGMIE